VHVVLGKHGDGALQEDRSVVVLGVGVVHGAARRPAALLEDGAMHALSPEALAAEGRQERGMDV
jgi:hypothetical protein